MMLILRTLTCILSKKQIDQFNMRIIIHIVSETQIDISDRTCILHPEIIDCIVTYCYTHSEHDNHVETIYCTLLLWLFPNG